MDTQHFHRFLASVPGSAGERLSWVVAVNMILTGTPVAAGSLVQLIGVDVIPALVEAGAPPAALRAAIDAGALIRHRELPGLIGRSGGRAVFAEWCWQAGYTAPDDCPEIVDLYRGTLGCSPAQAASGLHWSTRFDSAAAFATRFADDHLTGVIVVHARVPRSEIACFVQTSLMGEVIPAEPPTVFDVIADREQIAAAVMREAARQDQFLQAGYTLSETYGTGERIAWEARARMAAGVLPGTAIVT